LSEIAKYDPDKERFFKEFSELRPDLFMSQIYAGSDDGEEAASNVRNLNVRAAMMTSIPINCKGPSCPYASTCPLQEKKIAPIGKPCPIELNFISEMVYTFAKELSVPLDNLTELAIIRDLVDSEIQHMRASKILAMEEFIQENVVGIDESGKPIMSKSLHLATDMQERLLKRKKDIRNQLMATREQKAKMGTGLGETNQIVSSIFEQLREIDIKKEELLKKELGTLGKDDYISAHDDIIDAEEVLDDDEDPFGNL